MTQPLMRCGAMFPEKNIFRSASLRGLSTKSSLCLPNPFHGSHFVIPSMVFSMGHTLRFPNLLQGSHFEIPYTIISRDHTLRSPPWSSPWVILCDSLTFSRGHTLRSPPWSSWVTLCDPFHVCPTVPHLDAPSREFRWLIG